jgi:hypothetical protein
MPATIATTQLYPHHARLARGILESATDAGVPDGVTECTRIIAAYNFGSRRCRLSDVMAVEALAEELDLA